MDVVDRTFFWTGMYEHFTSKRGVAAKLRPVYAIMFDNQQRRPSERATMFWRAGASLCIGHYAYRRRRYEKLKAYHRDVCIQYDEKEHHHAN
jgi:hypothetical protein